MKATSFPLVCVIDWPCLGRTLSGKKKKKMKIHPSGYGQRLAKTLEEILNLALKQVYCFLVSCPNSCLFSRCWEQSKRSSNLSVPYLGNDKLRSSRWLCDEGSFCCLSTVFHRLLIPVLRPIISKSLLFVSVIFPPFITVPFPPSFPPSLQLNLFCIFHLSPSHPLLSLSLLSSTVTSLKVRPCACTTWQTSVGFSWDPTPTGMDPTTSGFLSKGGFLTPALEQWVSTPTRSTQNQELCKE